MSNDPLLDFYQTELDDLEQDYTKVKEQLRVEQDGPTQNKLERQIEQIGRQMDECQQKIDQRQADRQRQVAQIALDTLISILKSDEAQLELIIQAYQKTVSHWPVPVRLEANTVETIINELERIARGQSSYTARDEFIAHVVHQTSAPFLSNALNQWSVQYRAGVDWLQLHTQIQAAQDKRLETAEPAILMSITRCDEVSTQTQEDATYYQINAWLIEDIETYRSRKTGYHSLLATNSLESAPYLLEELLPKITHLLNHFLAEQRRLCDFCENYPQIHVFLPLELMHLGVDLWPHLNPENTSRREYLGHDHIVVIRCANRYDRNYRKSPSWLKLWKRHQGLLQESAKDVFVLGHDHDLDELMDVLDAAVQPASNVVGLHVTQVPLNTEDLFYELLDSGLPLAIWPRRNLTDNAYETAMADLLATCCLERLPHTVKDKRYETRRRQNAPDCHIGHHLSLLWDDPYLVPPKSA
ncbi:hypothetical protein H6F76_16375 [Leptolyngbya sp. FACHB-321]|uniref:VMAP-C domain-containing protein n=1 Tax=Leptolyngbya sp. FACHB-321 TaxID=2692807 RepID=UPI00168560D1|nr:hypothetical protein [Leptolyngbya sp. FACHB-321]MBD2036589.1 hypothetical protein [Leptolyngbya sp. FACHB-321]